MDTSDPPTTDDRPDIEQDDRAMLRDFLAERDTPCPACGYNLRQLEGGTCPECGNAITLSVGIVGGPSRPWITSLVCALIAAGVSMPLVLILGLRFANGLMFPGIISELQEVVFLLLLGYGVICMPVSVALLYGRQRYLRWKSELQYLVASLLIFCDLMAGFIGLVIFTSIF